MLGTAKGTAAGDQLGWSVAGAGDVNNDGFPDVVIGIPGDDTINGIDSGTAIVVSEAVNRGRTLAFNGVCGNLGVALAAGITAMLTVWLGWRGAFLVPAAVCIATGIAYVMIVPEDRHQTAGRSAANRCRGAARPARG